MKKVFLAVAAALMLMTSAGAQGALRTGVTQLLELEVKRLVLDSRTEQPVVFLEEKKGKQVLPIWIGFFEARAIAMELQHVTTPRPMTHDLMKNLLGALKVKVKRVLISGIKGNTYFARIALEVKGEELDIDSRPSDAIALALRAKAPIFAPASLMKNAPSLESLLPEESRWWSTLGIRVQELTSALAPHFGASPGEGLLVSDVRDGSSAERQGLRRGDIIQRINRLRIKNIKDLESALKAPEAESSLVVQVQRGKRSLTLTIHREKLEKKH
ncbi:MAG: bifunctional nuclease domain-containing protein [Nitrospinota bacterium]